jgi:hypothetical protein
VEAGSSSLLCHHRLPNPRPSQHCWRVDCGRIATSGDATAALTGRRTEGIRDDDIILLRLG